MLNLLSRLFGGRSRGLGGYQRRGGLGSLFGGRRGLALGGLASIAAPFLMRKLSGRRRQRAGLGAL